MLAQRSSALSISSRTDKELNTDGEQMLLGEVVEDTCEIRVMMWGGSVKRFSHHIKNFLGMGGQEECVSGGVIRSDT